MAIKKKLLTPLKFGLGTFKPFTADQIVTTVTKKLKTLSDLTPAAREVCLEVLRQSAKGKSQFPATFPGITPQDLGVITSDFGEVTGAVYLLTTRPEYSHAKFPVSEHAALVDYYLVQDGVDIPFSAKAGAGGAPSITAIQDSLSTIVQTRGATLSPQIRVAAEVLSTLNREDVYTGVLQVAHDLKLPCYPALIQLLRRRDLKTGYTGTGIPTVEQLQRAVDATGSFDQCLKIVQPLFRAAEFELGGARGETKMREVFAGTAGTRYKKWGMLHFPVTSAVMGWLNDPQHGATELLTLAAQTLSVNQIYLDTTAKNLQYTVHTFAGSSFVFHSPSSTPNPVGNRIGMKMVKRPHKI